MMPTDSRASVPRDGPLCPPSKRLATARPHATSLLPGLAEWLSRFCRLFDCGNCCCDGPEIPCRVLAPRPERRHEAMGDALLGAPETVLGQYQRVLFLSRSKVPDPPIDVTPDMPEPAPGGRRCPCGAPLAPRRKLCDCCRVEARRKTMPESQARWRVTVAARCACENAMYAGGEADRAASGLRLDF